MILIETINEYDVCVERRFQPLLDENFKMDIDLRIEIQKDIFLTRKKNGLINLPKSDEKFFRWIFALLNTGKCENCPRDIYSYAAIHCSHILTKASFPVMRWDPRNINILCGECHRLWENGTNDQKKKMSISSKNEKRIELLKEDYKHKF